MSVCAAVNMHLYSDTALPRFGQLSVPEQSMTIIKESTTVIKNIKMIITLCRLSSAVR